MSEHEEIGERGSGDVSAQATKEGVTLRMYSGEEGEAYCDLLPDAALRLGEWLIAQAISQGAGYRAAKHTERSRDDGEQKPVLPPGCWSEDDLDLDGPGI